MTKGLLKYHFLVLLREPMNLIFGFCLPFFFLFLMSGGEEASEAFGLFLLPLYMTIAIMVLCFTDSAMSHAHARQIKFLRRLKMTPIKPKDYIITGILSRICTLTIFTIAFMAAASVLYDLDFASRNWPLFISILLLTFAMFYFVAMFVASLLKNAKSTQGLIYIVFFALLIIGGNMAFQFGNMPDFLQTAALFFPSVLAINLMSAAWTGADIFYGHNFAAMVITTAIFALLSLKFFKFE